MLCQNQEWNSDSYLKDLLSGVELDNGDVVPRHPVRQLPQSLVSQLKSNGNVTTKLWILSLVAVSQNICQWSRQLQWWLGEVALHPPSLSFPSHHPQHLSLFGNPHFLCPSLSSQEIPRWNWKWLVLDKKEQSGLSLSHQPESEFCIRCAKLRWEHWWCPLPGCNLEKRSRQECTQETPWKG